MITCEELEIQVKELQKRIDVFEDKFNKLKEWSDLNDYWLHEMINSLTKCVDKIMNIYEEDD